MRWMMFWKTAFAKGAWRQVRILLFAMIAYLIQMSIMPHVRILGVTPSLLFAAVAIVTVCYGKLRGFWVGAFYGMLLETLQPTHVMFSLLLYPVASLLAGVMFADKSARQLEYERSLGKAGRNVTPYLRTPMCALVNVTVYEVVNLTYIYLREGSVFADSIWRGVLNLALTTALTALVMLPVRRMLGFRRIKKKPDDEAAQTH